MHRSCDLAVRYGAMNLRGRVHAVGMYARVAPAWRSATASWTGLMCWKHARQGIWLHGRIHCGSSALIDPVRSYAPGFIFTTPAAAHLRCCHRCIRHLKASNWNASDIRNEPPSESRAQRAAAAVIAKRHHIVPAWLGTGEVQGGERPVAHGARHYIQPINYPTVPRGTGAVAGHAKPYHNDTLVDALAEALVDVWARLGLAPKRWAWLLSDVRFQRDWRKTGAITAINRSHCEADGYIPFAPGCIDHGTPVQPP